MASSQIKELSGHSQVHVTYTGNVKADNLVLL